MCNTFALLTFAIQLHVWKSLDKDRLTADLKGVLSRGIKCLAVVLLHSYTFREHEDTIGRLAKEMGFTHVSLSSSVMPMVRIVPRGYTGESIAQSRF